MFECLNKSQLVASSSRGVVYIFYFQRSWLSLKKEAEKSQLHVLLLSERVKSNQTDPFNVIESYRVLLNFHHANKWQKSNIPSINFTQFCYQTYWELDLLVSLVFIIQTFHVTRSQAAVINKYLASVQPLSILFEVRSSCI